MLKLELRILGLSIDLNIVYKRRKADKLADIHESNSYDENNELNTGDDVEDAPIILSDIQIKASQFEKELKKQGAIFDIPSDSDYPPKHGINDDVEIITDSYEKEFEDIMEGRR